MGLLADVPWLYVTPVALRGVLNWITARYGRVEIKVCHSGDSSDAAGHSADWLSPV